MSNNPFNITKAVDYTDEELNQFWVDFPGVSFNKSIKPTSEVPMIIIGSKGSGKTHIMKHFSYTMQKIRHKNNIIEGVINDGYIGTYLRCSGLNAYKFKERGENTETWETIFAFYLELWLGQLILNNLCKVLSTTNLNINENLISREILDLFDSKIENLNISTLADLTQYLNTLQKNIDYAINNRAFTKRKISESIEVTLSPGSLIFGIPNIIIKNIKEFKKLKFLYLLDEYENFTESQQKYFNTLIRERKSPVCFKIGTRRYGFRTKKTLSAGEEIKRGSEYEELDIDAIFREDKKNYKIFIKEICIKRLETLDIQKDGFEEYFESFNEIEFYSEIQKKGRIHLKKLSRKLKHSKYEINKKKIISNLSFNKNILLERVNIMLFYRAWKQNKNLLIESEHIKKSCLNFFKSNHKNNSHNKILDKYKKDIIDALFRENKIKINTYTGLDNLIKISNGIPRHFLIIMKHIYRWNEFDEKKIFHSTESPISTESQMNAIKDTANWFFEDAKIPGEYSTKIQDAIVRLCDYLRELRFSDLPPECSISSFSITSKVLPKEIIEILDFLEQYSYLIELDSGRRAKNSNNRDRTYQINGLLAVQWELSLSRRGVLNFNSNEIEKIFIPKNDTKYKEMKNMNISKYNAPFSSELNSPTLFDI